MIAEVYLYLKLWMKLFKIYSFIKKSEFGFDLISDDEISNQIKIIDSLMKIKQRIHENDKNVAEIQGQIQQLIEQNKAPKKKIFTNPKYCFSKKIDFSIFLNLSTYMTCNTCTHYCTHLSFVFQLYLKYTIFRFKSICSIRSALSSK